MKKNTPNRNTEDAANTHESILQSVIDAPEGLIVFSLDNNYNYTSFSKSHKNTMKLIWGKDIELGQNMLDCILREDDREKAKQNFDKALKGESLILEEEYGEGEQRTFWENHYSPIFNEDGVVAGISVFVINITKRKILELELREKESALRATFYSIGDAVITTDINGCVVKMNSIAEELCGWKEAEAEGSELEKVFNIVNSFSRKKVQNPIDKVLNEGKIVGLANHTTLISKEGKEYQIADSAAPIRDKKGNIMGAVLVFRDVTEKYKLEDELRTKKELNEAILHAIPDLLFVFNEKYEFVFYSAPHGDEKLFYESPETFIGKSIFDILPTDIAEKTKTNIDFVLKNKASAKFDYDLNINGEKKYFTARLIYKGEKQVLTVVTDSTELKIAEKELEQSRADFQRIIELTSIGIIIHADEKFLYANDAALKIVGVESKEEFYNKSILSFVHPDFRNIATNRIKTMLETGNSVDTIIEKFLRTDGKEIFVRNSATPIVFNGKSAIMVFFDDITEQIEAEKKVKESEERLSTLINSTPDIICFKDGKGRWLTANDADLKLFKLENVDYFGKTDAELAGYTYPIFKEAFFNCIESDEKAWQKGDVTVNEEVIKTLEGDEKIYEVIKVPLFYEDGSRKGLVVLGRDITERKQAEKELEQSKTDFQRIIESSSIGIVIHADGKFLYANKAALKIVGVATMSELLNKSVFSFVHPDFRDIAKERIRVMLETGNSVETIIEKFLRQDGQEIFVRNSATPIIFNGKSAIMVFFDDMTEQIKAEEKIKENEEVFRTLAETTTAAIFVFSREKFLYVNKTAERITGYSAEELLKMNFWDVVHPDFKEIVKKRGQMRVDGNKVPESYEFKVLNKAGKGIWINFSASKIKWKGRGAALGSAVDITKRKNIELDLLKSENKYKLISKLTTDYIYESVIDANGNFSTVWVSESFEQITGYSLKEFQENGDWGSIVHPNDFWIEKESVKNVLNNRIGIAEVRIFKKDGSVIWVRSKGEPIWSDEEQRVVGVVGAVSDITERKRMIEELIEARRKAEASEKIKTDFLAQMSHEIRSPLNVVLNFISLIKFELRDKADEDLQLAFSSIDSSSRRIIRTVDLILNMTELQSGTYESVSEEVDVVKQIKNVIAEYVQSAKVKMLTLKFINEIGERKIVTDEYAFLHTIVNLIDNAVKYTNKGGVTVTLSENYSKDVVVEVCDTGIGISEEYLSQIFSAFSQEEQGYKRKFEGNGLGMALVKKYVEIMKGRISVESQKGVGTTFTLTIPDLNGK